MHYINTLMEDGAEKEGVSWGGGCNLRRKMKSKRWGLDMYEVKQPDHNDP